jgi:hypothetical protein
MTFAEESMLRATGTLKRAAPAAVACVLAAALISGPRVRLAGQAPPADLQSLFEPGGALQDRNGDGVIDAVSAAIVLGDDPTPADVAAASDVAARLGFETSAMDLPLSRAAEPALTVAIGTAGARRAGLPDTAVPLDGLAAGQGVVALRMRQAHPVVVVAGPDDAGTRAAAALLAGRLPFLADPKGPTLAQVIADARALLDRAGVGLRGIDLAAVRAASPGGTIARLDVEIAVAGTTDAARARQVLAARRSAKPAAGTPAAGSPERAGTGADTAAAPPLSYATVPAIAFRIVPPAGRAVEVLVPRAEAPEPGPMGRRPGAGAKDNLDLSSLYSIEGLLGDGDTNLIPERIDTILVPSGDGVERTMDVAARLGLESTGVVIPIAVPADQVRKPDAEPTMVLIGTSHPLIDRLVEQGKFERPTLEPGQGMIQVVRKAFGEKGVVIVTGGDRAGLARALEQLAERLPHVWQRGKDRTTLDDVEEKVRRFVSNRSPEGQASAALYMLDRIARELQARQLESAAVSVHVEKADPGLAAFVRSDAASRIKAPALEVIVDDLDVQKAGLIFEDDFAVASEVAEFWRLFDERVLPAVRRGRPVTLEARLSEPPAVRQRIADEATKRLVQKGASAEGTTVTVLSAYKQGYSWLYDRIRPKLEGQPVDRLTIRFAEIGPPPEWRQQAMYAPTRWLLELFPIDEVLARDMKVDLKKITFEKRPIGSPAYEVVATGPGGREILRETFDPKIVVRPFFDRFPDYEHVRVTTGWISAAVGGRTAIDQRIVTDPERFWDHYQSTILPRIYDYVMAIGEGKPEPGDAPYFGELTIDLTLSEPDYQVGVDKEQIASMEALHEEIYFNTLHFFDVLGRNSRGAGLDYPGRVIPIVRPKSDGAPGRAKVTFTGFKSIRPAVVVKYREAGGTVGEIRRDIRRVAVERPAALAAVVRAGRDGIERLDLRLKLDTQADQREDLIRRARAERVDEQILSAEQAAAMLSNLERLRAAGLYRGALAFHDLGGIRVIATWEHDPDPKSQIIASLAPNGRPGPWPDIRALLPVGYRHAGGPIVQWKTPIPPPEAYELLAKMSTFREATVYKAGESYLGKDVWAMDLMPPVEASHWSQAKQSTLKPTVVYSARQHANEVSSTSHVLKLAELLLTDPAFRKKLEKVNVVIHPITNPDGAQLAYDLYKITPDHMLHAGYLGSLGVDMTSAQWESDAIYPESRIRPDLWRTWLPDIFLNPHGYPSHEWVQLFSEYAGWVRNRATESRDWWGMRGWFIPGFGYLDDPKYPRHKAAAFEIRERITKNINAAPVVRALNQRAYDRYRRYGFEHDRKNFKMDMTNEVLIYTAVKGAKASAQASDFMPRQPKITIWTGGTEAPDETAYGDWLEMVATAGLQWDTAVLDYLVDGRHRIDRKIEAFFGGAALSIDRPRPPKPEEPRETETTGAQGR